MNIHTSVMNLVTFYWPPALRYPPVSKLEEQLDQLCFNERQCQAAKCSDLQLKTLGFVEM